MSAQTKLIRGDTLIEALQQTGLLPDHCVSVSITASAHQLVHLSYEVLADDRILQIAAAVRETKRESEAVAT